jgi:hypothetical protein
MGRERITQMIDDVNNKDFDGFKTKFDEEMSDRLDDDFEKRTHDIFNQKKE